MSAELDRGAAALADRLRKARRVTVLTGAGVPAASGIPTFRGAGGLWREYHAQDLATPEAFARDSDLVWEFYAWRREKVAGCRPNAAHEVLAEWSRRVPEFVLATQNIDGLHESLATRGVLRLHGSLWQLRCWEGCGREPLVWEDRSVPLEPMPPRCPSCGGLARPAVVWFGEGLDPRIIGQAVDACSCELFLTIGTSAQVYPAAGLVGEAAARGAFTVEINPDATPATATVDLALAGPAEAVLPRVDAAWQEE